MLNIKGQNKNMVKILSVIVENGEREYCMGGGKNQEGFQEEVAFEQNYVELHVILTAKIGNSLCILDINPLSDVQFANILSCSVGCLFILLIISFVVHKLCSLW